MVVPYHRFWEIQRKSGVNSSVVRPIIRRDPLKPVRPLESRLSASMTVYRLSEHACLPRLSLILDRLRTSRGFARDRKRRAAFCRRRAYP